MRILILAAAVGAAALPATAASAQYYGGYNNRVYQEQRDCNRALRDDCIAWNNSRGRKGLVTYSSTPAWAQRSPSPLAAWAVMATIGR